MFYKRKGHIVEAIQWKGDNFQEMIEFGENNIKVCWSYGEVVIQILTYWGKYKDVNEGEYVIKGLRGTTSKLFTMIAQRFEAIYEPYYGEV